MADEILQIGADASQLEQAVQSANRQLDALNARLGQAGKQFDDVNTIVNKASKGIQNTSVTIKTLGENTNVVTQKFKITTANVSKLEEGIVNLRSKIKSTTEDIAKFSNQEIISPRSVEAKKRVNELSDALENLRKQRAALGGAPETKVSTVGSAQASLAAAEEKLLKEQETLAKTTRRAQLSTRRRREGAAVQAQVDADAARDDLQQAQAEATRLASRKALAAKIKTASESAKLAGEIQANALASEAQQAKDAAARVNILTDVRARQQLNLEKAEKALAAARITPTVITPVETKITDVAGKQARQAAEEQRRGTQQFLRDSKARIEVEALLDRVVAGNTTRFREASKAELAGFQSSAKNIESLASKYQLTRNQLSEVFRTILQGGELSSLSFIKGQTNAVSAVQQLIKQTQNLGTVQRKQTADARERDALEQLGAFKDRDKAEKTRAAQTQKLIDTETKQRQKAANDQAVIAQQLNQDKTARTEIEAFRGKLLSQNTALIQASSIAERNAFENSIKNLQTVTTKFQLNRDQLAQVFNVLRQGGDLTGLTRGQIAVAGAINRVSKELDNLGKASEQATDAFANPFRTFARLAAVQITHQLIGQTISLFTQATSTALEFQKAIGLIEALSQELPDFGASIFPKGVRAIADEFGQSTIDVAKGVKAIVSSQVAAGRQAIEFQRVASQFATAVGSDAAKSAKFLTDAINAFGLSASDAPKVAGIFFKVIDIGNVEIEDLQQNLGRLAVTAREAGLTIEEVGAAIAVSTRQGRSFSVTSSNLRNLLEKLINPNEELRERFNDVGIVSIASSVKLGGFTNVIQLLSQTLRKEGVSALARILPELRGFEGGLALATDDAKALNEALNTLNNTLQNQKELTAAAANILGKPAVDLARQFQELQTFIQASFGEGILNAAQKLTQQFGSLKDIAKDIGSAISTTFSGIPIAIKIVTETINGLNTVFPTIKVFGDAIGQFLISPLIKFAAITLTTFGAFALIRTGIQGLGVVLTGLIVPLFGVTASLTGAAIAAGRFSLAFTLMGRAIAANPVGAVLTGILAVASLVATGFALFSKSVKDFTDTFEAEFERIQGISKIRLDEVNANIDKELAERLKGNAEIGKLFGQLTIQLEHSFRGPIQSQRGAIKLLLKTQKEAQSELLDTLKLDLDETSRRFDDFLSKIKDRIKELQNEAKRASESQTNIAERFSERQFAQAQKFRTPQLAIEFDVTRFNEARQKAQQALQEGLKTGNIAQFEIARKQFEIAEKSIEDAAGKATDLRSIVVLNQLNAQAIILTNERVNAEKAITAEIERRIKLEQDRLAEEQKNFDLLKQNIKNLNTFVNKITDAQGKITAGNAKEIRDTFDKFASEIERLGSRASQEFQLQLQTNVLAPAQRQLSQGLSVKIQPQLSPNFTKDAQNLTNNLPPANINLTSTRTSIADFQKNVTDPLFNRLQVSNLTESFVQQLGEVNKKEQELANLQKENTGNFATARNALLATIIAADESASATTDALLRLKDLGTGIIASGEVPTEQLRNNVESVLKAANELTSKLTRDLAQARKERNTDLEGSLKKQLKTAADFASRFAELANPLKSITGRQKELNAQLTIERQALLRRRAALEANSEQLKASGVDLDKLTESVETLSESETQLSRDIDEGTTQLRQLVVAQQNAANATNVHVAAQRNLQTSVQATIEALPKLRSVIIEESLAATKAAKLKAQAQIDAAKSNLEFLTAQERHFTESAGKRIDAEIAVTEAQKIVRQTADIELRRLRGELVLPRELIGLPDHATAIKRLEEAKKALGQAENTEFFASKGLAEIEKNRLTNANNLIVAQSQLNSLLAEQIRLQTEFNKIFRIGPPVVAPALKAKGGFISHGTDTVPAMLTPGEFVVNSKSTGKFFSQLVAINSGMKPQFMQSGGPVTNNSVGDINISVPGGDKLNVIELGKQLRREIRRGTIQLT